jgi:hydrogenase maturation factor
MARLRQDLQAVNQETQYGAWVLVHGYNVNHFTSLINSHKVPELDTIEKTAKALEARGKTKHRLEC